MGTLRLSAEYFDRLLASDDPSNALGHLSDMWCARLSSLKGQRGCHLSQPESEVNRYLQYVGEVGNGGHEQFFLNGREVPETLAALANMGLSELTGILVEACKAFPGSSVPDCQTERESLIEAMPEEAIGRWDRLDRKLWSISMASDAQVLAYVRAHRDDVLVPERTGQELPDGLTGKVETKP